MKSVLTLYLITLGLIITVFGKNKDEINSSSTYKSNQYKIDNTFRKGNSYAQLEVIKSRILFGESKIEKGNFYSAITLLELNTILSEEIQVLYPMEMAQTHMALVIAYDKIMNLEKLYYHLTKYDQFISIALPEKQIYKALYYSYLSRYYNIRMLIDKSMKYSTLSLELYHKNKIDAALIPEHLIYMNHLFSLRNASNDYKLKLLYRDTIQQIVQFKFPSYHINKSRSLISADMIVLDNIARYYNKNNRLDADHLSLAKDFINRLNKEIVSIRKDIGKYNPYNSDFEILIGLLYYYMEDYSNSLLHFDKGIINHTAGDLISNDFFTPNNYSLANAFLWKSNVLTKLYFQSQDMLYLLENEKILNHLKDIWHLYISDRIKTSLDFNINHYLTNPYGRVQENYINLYFHTKNNAYRQQVFKSGELSKHYSLQYLMEQKKSTEKSENRIAAYCAYEALINHINEKKGNVETWNDALKKISYTPHKIPTLNIKEVQKEMGLNQAIISYSDYSSNQKKHLWAHVITSKKDTIIFLTDDFLAGINPKNSLYPAIGTQNIVTFQHLGHLYYKDLLDPIISTLSANVNELIIIESPFIERLNINFKTLVSSISSSTTFKNLHYIGNRYAMSVPISVSNFFTKSSKKKFSKNSLTIFVAENVSLPSLHYKSTFLRHLESLYDVNLVKGEACNKQNFIRHLQQHKLILVLSHGKGSNSEEIYENGIFLTDSFFSINDLHKVNSNCELLILAGCQTGAGFMSNEGIISLARAFTFAGVESMLLSTDDIDEKSTLKILELWFSHLSGGNSKSRALQLAQKDYLSYTTSRKSNPSYWANLKLIDNSTSMEIKKKKTFNIFAQTLSVFLFLFLVLVAFRKLSK
jgi:hypothetical protein